MLYVSTNKTTIVRYFVVVDLFFTRRRMRPVFTCMLQCWVSCWCVWMTEWNFVWLHSVYLYGYRPKKTGETVDSSQNNEVLRRRTAQLLFQLPCWAELAGVHSMRRNIGPISVDRCRAEISTDSYGRIWEERFPDSERGLWIMCGYPDKTRLKEDSDLEWTTLTWGGEGGRAGSAGLCSASRVPRSPQWGPEHWSLLAPRAPPCAASCHGRSARAPGTSACSPGRRDLLPLGSTWLSSTGSCRAPQTGKLNVATQKD